MQEEQAREGVECANKQAEHWSNQQSRKSKVEKDWQFHKNAGDREDPWSGPVHELNLNKTVVAYQRGAWMEVGVGERERERERTEANSLQQNASLSVDMLRPEFKVICTRASERVRVCVIL